LNAHINEAKEFYNLKKTLKNSLKNNENEGIICYDFQKNLQIPLTNVSVEYYLRKFYCHNFGIHDLKTNKVFMYFYPENHAKKGCNEVISFINHYVLNIMDIKIKVLHIFSDNCFSQNKNKYLWTYYKFLVSCGKLDRIMIYYPIPGHSFMEIDGDFGRIEINKKNYGKIYYPSEYVPIIKNSNLKNHIQVIDVNFPISEFKQKDVKSMAKVLKYKEKISEIVKNSLENCSNVRKITINSSNVRISLSLRNECTIDLNLFKNNFNYKELNSFFENIPQAYDNYLPISRDKFFDMQKILKYIPNKLQNEFNFYDTLYSIDSMPIPKTQVLLHELFDQKNQNQK
jgi:hypothetical protein